MIPVPESVAAELEQLGVQVDRTTPDGPYMPDWVMLQGAQSWDDIRAAAADPALQAKILTEEAARVAEKRRLKTLRHRTLPHGDHCALLLRAFPQHPYLVLRAGAHLGKTLTGPEFTTFYKPVIQHAAIGYTNTPAMLAYMEAVKTDPNAVLPRGEMREAAALLRGLPVGAKLP